ncbi:MAG: hypothetical protein ACI92O_001631 [Colwellia sp.]|jgi:hypothetical protein|tara:strand:- start:6985 stop:7755 length:771 start_codon:yes stop_codon:yes gene_type:complete
MNLGNRMNINLKLIGIFSLSATLTVTSIAINAVEAVSVQQGKAALTSTDKTLLHSAEVNDIKTKVKNINLEVLSKPMSPMATKEKNTPLARALAQSENAAEQSPLNADKTLNLEISELKDNSGLVYLGGKVSAADLDAYLAQMKTDLGESQFSIFRQHQAARDHQTFHVTLVNPYEYQTIDKENFEMPNQFRVVLQGLGKVEKEDKKAYFVVASSPDGQFIRQGLLLKNKDFHVTLGFYPEDVFGVSKGRDTLIHK